MRLSDAEGILRRQLASLIAAGEFDLASGTKADGGYARIWYAEQVGEEAIAFESGGFSLQEEARRRPERGPRSHSYCPAAAIRRPREIQSEVPPVCTPGQSRGENITRAASGRRPHPPFPETHLGPTEPYV